MTRRACRWSRTLRLAFAPALALLLGCPDSGKSTSRGAPAPLIGATVVGFTSRAAAAGLGAGASVDVLDATTGDPVAVATVAVNGLEGDPDLGNAVAMDAAGLYWIESATGTIKRCDDR